MSLSYSFQWNNPLVTNGRGSFTLADGAILVSLSAEGVSLVADQYLKLDLSSDNIVFDGQAPPDIYTLSTAASVRNGVVLDRYGVPLLSDFSTVMFGQSGILSGFLWSIFVRSKITSVDKASLSIRGEVCIKNSGRYMSQDNSRRASTLSAATADAPIETKIASEFVTPRSVGSTEVFSASVREEPTASSSGLSSEQVASTVVSCAAAATTTGTEADKATTADTETGTVRTVLPSASGQLAIGDHVNSDVVDFAYSLANSSLGEGTVIISALPSSNTSQVVKFSIKASDIPSGLFPVSQAPANDDEQQVASFSIGRGGLIAAPDSDPMPLFLVPNAFEQQDASSTAVTLGTTDGASIAATAVISVPRMMINDISTINDWQFPIALTYSSASPIVSLDMQFEIAVEQTLSLAAGFTLRIN